jgi:hypothetical protein
MCWSPRLSTGVSEEEPQIRHVVRVVRLVGRAFGFSRRTVMQALRSG